MAMVVDVVHVFDSLYYEYYEIELFHRKVPRGKYMDEQDKEEVRLYQRKENARSKILLVADILRVEYPLIDKFMLTVRRWYKRTGWQYNASWDMCDRIWRYYAKYV